MDKAVPKTTWPLLWCIGLLTVPAFLFATVADAPHIIYMTGIGFIGTMLIRKPLPRTSRTYVYAGVIVAVSTVFQQQMFTIAEDRFFLLPAEIYCPALIFLGIALTYFDQRETNLSAIAGISIIATMLAGNTLGAFDGNTRFTLGNLILDDFTAGYVLAILIQVIFLLLLLPNVIHIQGKIHRSEPRYFAYRAVIYIVAVLFMTGGAFAMRSAALATAPRIQTFMQRAFRGYLRQRRGHVVFGEQVNLWETVGYKQRNERAIMIRAASPSPPGYLRGRAYQKYRRGRWTGLRGTQPLLYREGPENVATSIYARPGWPLSAANLTAVDIYPAGRFRSDVLLVPGNAGIFEIIAEDLLSDPSGVLQTEGWDQGGGYTARVSRQIFQAAYPAPAPEEEYLESLTELPLEIADALAVYADGVFTSEADSAMALIRQLEHHFEANFTYELEVDLSDSRDPVLGFLERAKRGHCELFASSAALLLRSRGIPTRYVTGFVCAEAHPYGDHWVSRLEDAHAWVEAYLPDEERWVLVETTPPAGIPSGHDRFEWLSGLFDHMGMQWQNFISKLKRGYAARWIIRGLTITLAGIAWFVIHPIRGPLSGILAIGLTIWVLRYLQTRRLKEEITTFPDEILQLQKIMRRIEKHLAGRGIRRLGSQTLREVELEARAIRDPLLSEKFTSLIRDYESLRYRLETPDKNRVKAFDFRVREYLDNAGSHKSS